MMKTSDSIDRVNALKAFLETSRLPEFPVEVPAYGVLINPRKFLKDKIEKIEKNPGNHHYTSAIRMLEAIMSHFRSFA